MPGYVRQYMQHAAPLVDIEIDGEMERVFSFRPARLGSIDPLLQVLELYPEEARESFSVSRPVDSKSTIWLHPGEPVFERFRSLVTERLADQGARGAVFVDPTTEKPYLFHMALLSVVRKADADFYELSKEEVLDCWIVGVKQYEGAEISLCPVEHLLLLKGGRGIPTSAQRLAATASAHSEQVRAFLIERIAREMALKRRSRLLEAVPQHESFIERGFDYQEAELAAARARHSEKARTGNRRATEALEEVKAQQRLLSARRNNALAVLRHEPELIEPGEINFIAHALVVPSSEPADREQHDANVEMIAMKVAQAFEEAAGASVKYVHTPELARAAGLPDHPGFDLLSIRSGNEKRAIEVKGRAGTGEVEVLANEWAKACNMRQGYWLYAVYDCATPNPRLARVQDPFGSLLAKAKGSMLISAREILVAAGAGA
jgi:hypothetical protein